MTKNCCFYTFFVLLLNFFTSCFSLSPPYSNNHPWLTGPLLTPSARVISKGHANIEPYLYWTVKNGKYGKNWQFISAPNFYTWNPQLYFKIGIAEKWNFSSVLQSSYNYTQGASAGGFGDLSLGFDYQLVDRPAEEMPIKLSISEIFPTGKYQKMDPSMKGTQAFGLGSFATQIGLTTSKLFHFSLHHYLNIRANATIAFSSPVHVVGINSYGGDPSTHGTVYPGTFLSLYLAGEYTLTDNWALALDILCDFGAKTRFKGHTQTAVKSPSLVQITLAPAIEYNWNKEFGIIVGSVFTVAGRNSASTVSAAAAININY